MKNKSLIIGGVAIVALGAYWWMKKKNEMTSSQDGSTADSK
jgi:LPXTG-motif cell wall-anchored protein